MSTSSKTQTVNHMPAPWELTGSGLIVPFWLAADFKQQHFPNWHGRLAILMFVDYLSSPVGPYKEWMLIPGKVENPRGRHYSISQIRVDSKQSVIGGQQNWGIPKALAAFDFAQSKSDWQMRMEQEDSAVEVEGHLKGPALPIHSGLVPFSLYQHRQATHYWTRPKAKGWGRWMTINSIAFQGSLCPDLSSQKCLGAFAITRFNMVFPVAETKAVGDTMA